MKLLPTPVFNTNLFHYHRERNEFFQEMSSLIIPGFKLGQVYDDAVDQGFTLYNPKTGGMVQLVESETITHGGEVMGWLFVPVERKKYDFTVKIIND